MPETVIHELEVDEVEIRGAAVDRRHRVILPDWELIEIDALGDRIPPAAPLLWEAPRLMLAGFDGGSSEPEDGDWELVELLDPDEDEPEPIEDLIEWPGSEDDWELEELDAIGDSPPEPEPSDWSGSGFSAAGLGGGGSVVEAVPDDEDWELESLAFEGQEGNEDESEDAIEEDAE